MRELLARIDEAIAERHLLNHPFCRDWQAGTLRRKKLQLYAGQYYLRGLIFENLAKEEDVAAPQAKVWRGFAAAVGVSAETLWSAAPLPDIRRLVETCREIQVM
jgi:pyrroloquinoline quinone (PQQ) biosynthesis protein C